MIIPCTITWHADNLKNDKICPLAIPNQISTISMPIPSLVKIDWYLHALRLSSRKKILMCDGQITVKNWQNLSITFVAIQTQLQNINAHTKHIWKWKYKGHETDRLMSEVLRSDVWGSWSKWCWDKNKSRNVLLNSSLRKSGTQQVSENPHIHFKHVKSGLQVNVGKFQAGVCLTSY